MISPEDRIKELKIKLPNPPNPVANYVPVVQTGNLLFVSGNGPGLKDDKTPFSGKPGISISEEDAIEDIVSVLTDDPDNKTFSVKEIDTESSFSYHSEDKFECSLLMNKDLLDRDIGDGFPLLPATRDKVDELISAITAQHAPKNIPSIFGKKLFILLLEYS